MTDMEKIVEGFEMSYRYSNVDEDNTLVSQQLVLDALSLLKDPDRIKVTRCKDCSFFEPSNAEEGDNSGYCRNDYAPCQNQTVDAWWFCGSAERG